MFPFYQWNLSVSLFISHNFTLVILLAKYQECFKGNKGNKLQSMMAEFHSLHYGKVKILNYKT